MKTSTFIILIVIALSIISIITFSMIKNNDESFSLTLKKSSQEKNKEEIPQQNPTTGSAVNPIAGSSGSSQGAPSSPSSTAESSAQSPQQNNCIQYFSYSLSEFLSAETCIGYQSQTCIEKTLNCSVIVTNLDYESEGKFTILVKTKSQEQILQQAEISQVVQPKQELSFSHIFTITNPSQEIGCSITTSEIPLKNIC